MYTGLFSVRDVCRKKEDVNQVNAISIVPRAQHLPKAASVKLANYMIGKWSEKVPVTMTSYSPNFWHAFHSSWGYVSTRSPVPALCLAKISNLANYSHSYQSPVPQTSNAMLSSHEEQQQGLHADQKDPLLDAGNPASHLTMPCRWHPYLKYNVPGPLLFLPKLADFATVTRMVAVRYDIRR